MNVICLLGRLTTDPELRRTQTDTAVTSFSVAVDRHSSPRIRSSVRRISSTASPGGRLPSSSAGISTRDSGLLCKVRYSPGDTPIRMATNARPLRWLSTTLSLLNPKMQAERRPAAPGMIPRFPSTAKRPLLLPPPMRPILRKLKIRIRCLFRRKWNGIHSRDQMDR